MEKVSNQENQEQTNKVFQFDLNSAEKWLELNSSVYAPKVLGAVVDFVREVAREIEDEAVKG